MKTLKATHISNALRVFACMLTALTCMVGAPRATFADLPIRPQPGLPERPDALHAPLPSEPGGHIYLLLEAPEGEYWAEVEWEGASRWYLVEGWRDHTLNRQLKWFVRDADFGKGPFRWRVYRRAGGDVVATSAPFFLPNAQNGAVDVRVAVPSP